MRPTRPNFTALPCLPVIYLSAIRFRPRRSSRRSARDDRRGRNRMAERYITGRHGNAVKFGLVGLIVLLLAILVGVRWAASLLIDYSWWKEIGQVHTWLDLYAYSTLPVAAGTIAAWILLLVAHASGVRFAGGRVSDYPIYSRLSSLVLLGVS